MIDFDKWQQDGYYVLPSFYTNGQIDHASDVQRTAWRDEAPRIVVDDLMTGKRLRMQDVSEQDKREHRFDQRSIP